MKLFNIWALVESFQSQAILSGQEARCDGIEQGYGCFTPTSRLWGEYSPYFAVDDSASPFSLAECKVTFAQVLSRHGARFPTAPKGQEYNATILKVKKNVKSFSGVYRFLEDYIYTLGADNLTHFGQQELHNSGIQFYRRYRTLTESNAPFVRASGSPRVVMSGQNWTQGFQEEKGDASSIPVLVIPEGKDSNNTLSHGLCRNFSQRPFNKTASRAKKEFATTFVPDIQNRLNSDLPGANLNTLDVLNLMDLCPMELVAMSHNGGILSPFCALFTEKEWHSYNYYQSLDKYYGYGRGNKFGPTGGVGFVNELIARMTGSSVQDHTSVNHTLDNNPKTFPLGGKLYADFSHDNEITGILAALGLYNKTETLPLDKVLDVHDPAAAGYSAAWTVPFSARVYFEKIACNHHEDELVRVVVNDRVVPLVGCGADDRGMCTLRAFVESQSFARDGGLWDECFDWTSS